MTVTELLPCAVQGAGLLPTVFHVDSRGSFAKPFSAAGRPAALTGFEVREVFWSRSETGVVRGLHFQRPPTAVAKIVFVTAGRVLDVVVDLREDSPTFGCHDVIELGESTGAVYVPKGCAHGFEVVDGPAVTCYLQDGPFDPATDTGIRWDSAGIAWTTRFPTLSPRDAALPALDELPSVPTADWTRRA